VPELLLPARTHIARSHALAPSPCTSDDENDCYPDASIEADPIASYGAQPTLSARATMIPSGPRM